MKPQWIENDERIIIVHFSDRKYDGKMVKKSSPLKAKRTLSGKESEDANKEIHKNELMTTKNNLYFDKKIFFITDRVTLNKYIFFFLLNDVTTINFELQRRKRL